MDRFKQPMSVILQEDASLLRYVQLEGIERARRAREEGGDGFGE
jgi:hypothetical protein